MTGRISLTWDDIETAASVGLRRSLSASRNGTRDKYGAPASGDGGVEIQIFGAIVEFAVAQYFNLHWRSRVGDVRAVDVGGCVEVKSARRITDCLLLHPDYKDDLPFVLGIVQLPAIELRGWIFAREGKQKQFWRDPVGGRPAFFVPQSVLHPMPELKTYLRSVLSRYELEPAI